MSESDLVEQLEALDGQISNLEQLLKPLTSKDVAATVQKLPILDQSKLHVLTAYAANSLLFSALKLNGQDPRSHAVFTELARTKQYFEKIKLAEENASEKEEPRARLDKAAAGRFVKAGLAGNEKFDREREAREAAQREGAKRKLEALEGRDAGQPTEENSAEWETQKTKKAKKAEDKKAQRRQERDQAWASMAQETNDDTTMADDGHDEEAQEPQSLATATPKGSKKTHTSTEPDTQAKSSSHKQDKKEKKKFKKSSKAPRGASEVMQDLLQKGSDGKMKKKEKKEG